MDLGLDGKVAIVTGGGEGIGRAAAHRLAAEGASVLIIGRRPAGIARSKIQAARAACAGRIRHDDGLAR